MSSLESVLKKTLRETPPWGRPITAAAYASTSLSVLALFLYKKSKDELDGMYP